MMAQLNVLESARLTHAERPAIVRWLRSLERTCVRSVRWAASRRSASIVFVGLLGFVAPMLYALTVRVPEPIFHDEFWYVMAAETYARGRLTNPTHPCWKHFESVGLLQQPTYMSKNPPGQSVMLAAGQLVFGHPIYGVWLSAALAAAATCWMLQSWTRPTWALIASLVMIIMVGVNSYWTQSYWGGMVAVLGSALTLGGLRRTFIRPSVLSSVLLGTGLLILANSRLYEGLLLAIPVGVTYLTWLVRRGLGLGATTWLRSVLPLGLVLAAGAAAMAINNRAVTGSFLRLPYAEYDVQYDAVPHFTFLPQTPPSPTAPTQLRRYYEEYELPIYQDSKRLSPKITHLLYAFTELIPMILGPIMIFPLFLVPWMGSNRWLVWAVAAVGWVMAGQVLEVYEFRHFLAPIVPLILLLMAEGLRRLRALRGRGRVPIRLRARDVMVVFVLCAAYTSLHEWAYARRVHPPVSRFPQNRREILNRLAAIPGRHLVLVRYAPNSYINDEWVFNGAEIDQRSVIFAHDLSPEQNQSLLEYFRDRHVWSIYVEKDKVPELKPYPLPPSAHTN